MNEEEREYGRRGDDLEVKTAWATVRAGGRQVSIIVITVLLAGLLGVQQYYNHESDKGEFKDIAVRQRENVKTITDSQQRLTDSIEIQTYMSTRTEAEKQAMRMDMPDALCRKIDCFNRSGDRRPR